LNKKLAQPPGTPQASASRTQDLDRQKKLLTELDSRVSEMEARQRQIAEFTTDLDKGNVTLCFPHIVAGDGICNGVGPDFKGTSLLVIVNELSSLDIGVSPKTALQTLGDMEAENGEILNSANRRIYPDGLLTQRLEALRTYSQEAWKQVRSSH
jgi:hypothetical protein